MFYCVSTNALSKDVPLRPFNCLGDASFETPEKQAERQALKTHKDVVAALEDTWAYFAKDDQNRISKEEYARVRNWLLFPAACRCCGEPSYVVVLVYMS